MYKKVLLAAAFIAFLCVQLGATLNCHSCTDPVDCRNRIKTITCTEKFANDTNVHLNKYFTGVPNVTSRNYNCIYQNYTRNLKQNMTYMGCAFRESRSCQLNLNSSHSDLSREKCIDCSGEMCAYYTGSAVSYFTSTFTVFATVLTALLAKSFAF